MELLNYTGFCTWECFSGNWKQVGARVSRLVAAVQPGRLWGASGVLVSHGPMQAQYRVCMLRWMEGKIVLVMSL